MAIRAHLLIRYTDNNGAIQRPLLSSLSLNNTIQLNFPYLLTSQDFYFY